MSEEYSLDKEETALSGAGRQVVKIMATRVECGNINMDKEAGGRTRM